MADIVSPEQRSRMMAGIRGKDTKPEIIVRRLLHQLGYRFRLHRKDLPGRPDVVLPKWKTVVFVNGCYWHGHAGCELYRPPKTRTEFWDSKIDGNRRRDEHNYQLLREAGWNVVLVWECAVSKGRRLPGDQIVSELSQAIRSGSGFVCLRGFPADSFPAD